MLLTAVIPTRNRPHDLCEAVASILVQKRMPDELIIVDQSPGPESEQAVRKMFSGVDRIALVYVHDTRIAGLVPAKKESVGLARGDLVCFLEDDVVLEPDYLAEIERGFVEHQNMLGCCGVVVKQPPLPPGYNAIFHLFHRGIYRDPRVGVHGYFSGTGHALIPSRTLSGGLSAWRREVFKEIPFDVENGFFMLEDMDFSTRAWRRFGERFFINPNARLEHHMSPVNREQLGVRQSRKLREYLLFYKKRRDWPRALPALLWLIPGLFLEALFQAVSSRAFSPVAGFFRGLWQGIRQPLREKM
jgi:glucosyl-dolichyl phosphate glucuronosyltransferase